VPKKWVQFTFKVNASQNCQQQALPLEKGKGCANVKRKRKRGGQVGDSQDVFSFSDCASEIKSRICNEISKILKVLSVGSFPIEQLPLLLGLCRESRLQTQFWTANFPNVQFSPSHQSFEMLQVSPEELKTRITALVSKKTVISVTDVAPRQQPTESSSQQSEADCEAPITKPKETATQTFTRSELCRFSSIIEGLRKSHLNVLLMGG
jgi:hypothetical protein